jgi:hypothetical protein
LPPDHSIRSLLSTVTIIAVLVVGATKAQAWPRIAGETNNRQCLQAYRLATTAVQSTNAWLFWPTDPPRGLGSKLSLRRAERDISGGHGLVNDSELFSTNSASDAPGAPTTIFWQLRPGDGKRIAVVDQPFNWQGDTYTIYVLSADVTPDELANDSRAADEDQRYKPVVGRSWNPPLVLIDDESATSWFLDVGEPYQILADWRVYTVNGGVTRSPCTVSFHPNMKSAVSLLPRPVQRFAALLDSTLGSGQNEGTLHPTARLRLQIAEAWANASLRPWALVDAPYNTREQVDEGLMEWARLSTQRAEIHENIRRQYPGATKAFTRYYQIRFRLPLQTARAIAAYVTDLMYRSYFVFHRDVKRADAEAPKNPWPAQLH